MRHLFILYITITLSFIFQNCKPEPLNEFILVKGGNIRNTKSILYKKDIILNDFYLSTTEVSQKDWTAIMGNNPSKFKGDNLPVETVSWYDCIDYCNKRSVKEGLKPYYTIDKLKKDTLNKNEFDSIKWHVVIDKTANGYRLPTEFEWEYAASGGQKSKSFTYSGGDDINKVSWYWRNSGEKNIEGDWDWNTIEKNNCKTHPVGLKKSNELGFYDMSGNVREWCDEWYQDNAKAPGMERVQRGGGWIGGEYRCQTIIRHYFNPAGKGPDQGFRLCRSSL